MKESKVDVLVKAHGTPATFRRAVYLAFIDGTITFAEFTAAADKYENEFMQAYREKTRETRRTDGNR